MKRARCDAKYGVNTYIQYIHTYIALNLYGLIHQCQCETCEWLDGLRIIRHVMYTVGYLRYARNPEAHAHDAQQPRRKPSLVWNSPLGGGGNGRMVERWNGGTRPVVLEVSVGVVIRSNSGKGGRNIPRSVGIVSVICGRDGTLSLLLVGPCRSVVGR